MPVVGTSADDRGSVPVPMCDPANCPGVRQGHYGLLGIRERVEGFEGDIRINSASGQGTKVVVALNVPQERAKENLS